jgi:ubiquinone biosynthesis protein UbiJ
MIKEYSLSVLQQAIHHALRLDPSLPEKLEPIHGKVIEMIIRPLRVHFFIRFEHQTIQLMAEYDGTPNTTIHSSPLGLIRLSLLPASKVRSLFNESIQITGDILLGQTVKQLFDNLDIDWEGHLAHFTGDVVAHQVGSFMRRGLAFKTQLETSMQHHISEYLHEEIRAFPPREEVNDFYNDIDALSLQVERLAAHIHQYLAHHETS